MLICPDWNRPLIIDDLNTPMVAKHFWTFSGPICDYMLSTITFLEESSGPTMIVSINDFEFNIPASWYILVADPDTYQLDTIPISSCSNAVYHAVAMSPDDNRYRLLPINVVDFLPAADCVHPMLQKGHGLQHPAGLQIFHGKQINLTVTIGPFDLYKFIEDKAVGDIF